MSLQVAREFCASLVTFAMLAIPQTAHAQGRASDSALALVQAGLEALGEDSLVSSLRSVRLMGTGTRTWRGQGSSPQSPTASMPLEIEWRVDYVNRSVLRAQKTFQGDEVYFCIRSIYTPEIVFSFECVTEVYMPSDPQSVERRLAAALAMQPEPRSRLLDASARPHSLRYVGRRDLEAGPHHVVMYTDEGGNSWTLYFETTSHFLTRVEGSETQLPLRTETFVQEYADYRSVDGLSFPFTTRRILPRVNTVGSVITDEVHFSDIEVNSPIDDAVFAVPERRFLRRPDDQVTITEVADGVFFLENSVPNYNQLVVEFENYLMVVDAPSNSLVSQRVLETMAGRVPDKPIRYLVTTHFHHDHIGGLPEYVERGARIVTTPGNQQFVRELVQSVLDAELSQEPEIDVVRVSDEFSDSSQRVKLFDIGPNPHAEELLMVYLPLHRMLYVPDVFSVDWGRVRPAIPETVAFAEVLRRLALDVETILPSHGPRATRDDLEWSLSVVQSPAQGTTHGLPNSTP